MPMNLNLGSACVAVESDSARVAQLIATCFADLGESAAEPHSRFDALQSDSFNGSSPWPDTEEIVTTIRASGATSSGTGSPSGRRSPLLRMTRYGLVAGTSR